MPATRGAARGLAIFDLDGTLVDSRQDLAEAGNAAREAIGLPALPPAAVVGFVGDGVEKLIERLTPDADAVGRAVAMAEFRTAYAAGCCRATVAYEGIAAAVAALAAAGWALGVATNKSLEFTRPILAHVGLLDAFAAIEGGDRARKPDPAQLLAIMRVTGVDADHTWMVGDHRTDILAGRAAGVRVAWCAWGMGRRDGLAADAVVRRPADLPAALLGTARAGA